MHEQRITTRLINLWEHISKDSPLPDYARFNHNTVEDLWQNCMVLVPLPCTANRTQLTLQLHHVGRKLSEVLGNASVGNYIVARAREFTGAKIIQRVGEVMEQPQPIEESGQFVNERSKIIKYRSCLLPFGNANDGVTHVLVGLSWREF